MSATRFNPVRRDPAHPLTPPAPSAPAPAPRLLPLAAGPRMRALLVLSSGPVDLGVETALFELTARLAERVAYTIRTDGADAPNLALIEAFAARHEIPVEVGPAADLKGLLRRAEWDLVETAAWVDPAALDMMLAHLGDRALVATCDGPVDSLLVQRADAVLCASPEDRRTVQHAPAPGRNHCYHLSCTTDWDVLAVQKWQILAGTWFTRHYLDRPFQGPRPAATGSGR